MQQQFDSLSNELTLVKRAIHGSVAGSDKRRVKVPEPKPFSGARSAKDLENFLWDMEQYFKAVHTPVEEMVTIATMYLHGDAKLWWRTRVDNDQEAGRAEITQWDNLKKELKDQFLPCNVAWVAREALRKLKHNGAIREYVKQFTSLMLDVKNMSEDDKLFNFMSGLQGWAQAELRRQNVKDLTAAVAAAEALVDYKAERTESADAEKSKSKGSKNGKKKNGNGDDGKDKQFNGNSEPGKPSTANSGCFICQGPHRARECPKKEKLNALVAANEQGEVPVRVNPMQLLGGV